MKNRVPDMMHSIYASYKTHIVEVDTRGYFPPRNAATFNKHKVSHMQYGKNTETPEAGVVHVTLRDLNSLASHFLLAIVSF